MLSPGSNVRRGNAAQSSAMPPLPQCLPLEPIMLGNQKSTRSGELRRVLGFPLGSTSEDHSFGVSNPKPPPSVATEELKNFKESVQDASRKSKDRAKMLRDSIFKLDKYRDALSSKKRQRSDLSSSERSNGVSLVKPGSHKNPHGIMTQRLEDRAKGVGLSKRIRTSVADVQAEARSASTSRQKVVTDKDENMLQAVSGSSVRIEEKTHGLLSGGEVLDQKTKKKRSVGAVSNRVMGGEQDVTRATHPKLSGDSKLRSCDSNIFRLKSSPGVSGNNKSDGSVESNNFSTSTVLKNEPESAVTKDRSAVLEPKIVLKANHKIKVQEDNVAGSPSTLIKGKVSRAPRTGSNISVDSTTVPPSSGVLQAWEQHTGQNKIQAATGINNQKHAMPNGSSIAMAQWVGQRTHKTSRTRRTNLVSPVSNNGEAQICNQGVATSDFHARTSSAGTNGAQLASSLDNHTPKCKKELQNASSPYGLTGSEELGAGENKWKDKGTNSSDIALATDQKAGAYLSPIKRNKLLNNESGDGVRRQGRSGRGPTPLLTRPGIPPMRVKSENLPTKKHLEDMKPVADNNKSKTGRPPPKKQKDRKALARVQSISSSDFTGESDDDHEELYLAASSARDASSLACSGPFWKKMESIFGSLSSEDMSYLKRQLSLAEELDESLSWILGDETNVSAALRHRELPNCSGERQGNSFNQDSSKTESLCDKFGMRRLEKVTPLYQRVLSALIQEDESEELYNHREGKSMHLQYASDDSHCGSCNLSDVGPKDWDRIESEVESKVDIQNQKSCLLDRLSFDRSAGTNTFRNRNRDQWHGDDEFSHSDAGHTYEICPGQLQPRDASTPSFPTSDCQYQSMCLDDRLLLELQSIGLYPETPPDLTSGEEVINQDIMELEQGLHQQIGRKKKSLAKIDKTIQKETSAEKGRIELVAMDQLIAMAYRKRMACRGYNGSKSAVRKVSKHVALAFLKRTLARCRKLEERGISCFSDPALQNVIFSSPTCNNVGKSVDCVGSGTASNTCNDAHQTEVRGSGAVSSGFGRYDSHSDNLYKGSSEALHVIVDSSAQDSSKLGSMNLNKDKGKKREVLLSDILGSASSRITSTVDSMNEVKEKRTERDKDQSRDNLRTNAQGGAGGSSLDSSRGERRITGKPQQNNNTHLPSHPVPNASNRKGGVGPALPGNTPVHSSKEPEDPVDYGNMQLDELNSMEELGPSLEINENQDLGSWLNFDDDGLQDHDCIGLEIPMDDLTGLSMLI
ncbi:hypothetical protein RchiOBHm_Chr5g0044401 [Rosa chinensis]|uniref:Uncharacterized protein n=1 Tax=Rosa chinensis TaxID=74649 RepID=A0A2P6QDK9_ROSCH|nr:uncharacterized protein LOC112201864 isoform X2 [Rosa chinensis]PRQ32261.1 hypothetical protein RchiOBHm_Chr5g0044401 [Rosa chinensis]